MQTRRTDQEEIRNDAGNQILTFSFSIKNGSNYGRSFCIQCSVDSKDLPPSCSFSRLKELGLIHTGVEMPNGTGNFRNFQISRKKDNLERWTEIFETNFRKLSLPFDFEPEFPEILVEWNAPQLFCLPCKSNRVTKRLGCLLPNVYRCVFRPYLWRIPPW